MSALTNGVLAHAARETAVVTRRVETHHENGAVSFRSEADHRLEARVEVWIDYASLLRQMAEKAIKSKAKVSRALNGAIVVKALNHRKLPL